jgi:hypothetical protein
MRHYLKLVAAAGLLLFVFLPVAANADTVAEIERIRPGDLDAVGFELPRTADVDIDAVGLRKRYGDDLLVYAWIIDAKTREPVWVMRERHTDRASRHGALREEEKSETLDAGRYELYMYAGDGMYGNWDIRGGKDVIDFLADLFDNEEWDDADYDDLIRECHVRLNSDDVSAADVRTYDVTGEFGDPLIRYTELGDNEFIRQPFRLDREMTMHIYALIEHPRGYRHGVDYGWIVNADTREKVWEMDRWSTVRGGGGTKNRKFDDDIRLGPGNYVLHYVTDDSHSFERFNVSPPYDPYNWGITVFPTEDFDRQYFTMTEPTERPKPLIDLTRARDDDYMEQAFRLKQETKLRVYAIGECPDRDFVDYGWIQKAGTGDIVWEMTYRNTDYAGGGDKNRMFDGFITLPAGEYVAAYMTDGSHSYRDWNVAQPFDPAAWGLAIYPAPDTRESDIELVSMDDLNADSDILVSITRVRDRERIRRSFTLDQRSDVRIYAIGEGTDGRMYDYGWIEDESGRIVWEMTYRRTDNAGGADKNRMFDGTISLDPGTYEVYYETDGSHSFNDWNATRPRDPRSWGITVSMVPDNQAKR